jgi:hypothetical protein
MLKQLGATHVWLQYTANTLDASRFGSWAMPLLGRLLQRQGMHVTAVMHELWLPLLKRPDLALAAGTTRVQLAAMLRACDAAVVTTEARHESLRWLAALTGARTPLTRVPVGPNALPVPAAPPEGGPHVGTYSTMAVGKRFDVVLDAFSRIVREHPGAQLWLIGDLSNANAKRRRVLESTLAAHPAAASIHVTGPLLLKDVAARVAALHVFLFPMDVGATTRSGTLPVALGSGLPVVALCGKDTGPLFAHGQNIWLTHALSGSEFSESALRILGDATLARTLGDGARALHDCHLAWPPIVDGLLSAAGISQSPRAPEAS